ncbi:MAG: GNAT family N-acetyltransferase, partial [Actinomycetota bacterium]|nr:GNAT family N-acetyltransferase [Actinomycetota bacterium]
PCMGAVVSDTPPSVELNWRPMRRDDVAALTRLMAAAEAVDQTEERSDEDDVVEHFMSGLVDLDADTRLVWDGEVLIGYAEVFGQRQVREVHSIWLGGTVHPDHRRRGLGRQLLKWQLARADELHAQRHPMVPANVMCDVTQTNVGLAALARSEGLAEIRFWFEMVRQLENPDPPLPPVREVEGLRLEPYDTGRDEEVRQAHNTAFRGHFGSTERDPEEWRAYFTGSRAFRPELSLLAVTDDQHAELAGYLLTYVYEVDVVATGRRELYIGQLGTMPSFRGRGVGSVLLATGLAQWSAAGHQDAYLGVDAANETGALGLYERAGFTVRKRSTSWGRKLPAQS